MSNGTILIPFETRRKYSREKTFRIEAPKRTADFDDEELPTRKDLLTEEKSTKSPSETLLHLAARLGHEEILRSFIGEVSQIEGLINDRGQTILLTAIESGSTSVATFLLSQNPSSLTDRDFNGSSLFHYATQTSNGIVLSRAISLLKRLNSASTRYLAIRRLSEKNHQQKTPLIIAIEKDSMACVKHILTNRWIQEHVDIDQLITADALKTTIDDNRDRIASFLVSDLRRFTAILNAKINVNGKYLNVLEYAIALRKVDFVRILINVRVPSSQHRICRSYKKFLKHYNGPSSGSTYDRTPIQRMLTIPEMVPLVPLLLEQFISESGVDLSIVDDCLYSAPSDDRCLFGRGKRFTSSSWIKEHPLSLIAEANYAPVIDHYVVRLCVDLKFKLFGNFLYFLILLSQILFVGLFTGVALTSPTPPESYLTETNETCQQICSRLKDEVFTESISLRRLRFLLLLISFFALIKELIQMCVERTRYVREMLMNLLEIGTFVSAILFSLDLNSCCRKTGFRCKWQYESGALGMITVWTLFLPVFMNSLKIGRYGLLFINAFLTFVKFTSIYVVIWIGYIIAFHMLFINKSAQFTSMFFIVPKTLAMFTGEFDFDDLFFPNDNFLQGSHVALIVFSLFVFTMNMVMMNILVGLAVSDVKSFNLNAKRQHMRTRIDKSLLLQSKFGILSQICAKIVLYLSKTSRLPSWSSISDLWKLEVRTTRFDISSGDQMSRASKTRSQKEQIFCQTAFYRDFIERTRDFPFEQPDQQAFDQNNDELKDLFEKANTGIYNEIRKLVISFQAELDDVKRRISLYRSDVSTTV